MSGDKDGYKGLSQAELKAEMLEMIKRSDAARLRKELQAMSDAELRARALAVAELLKEKTSQAI